jgi:mRNA interferase RelE/StbE
MRCVKLSRLAGVLRVSEAYEVVFSRTARLALEVELPEKIATAAFEFVMGALRENPHRVGKALLEPLAPLYSARRGEYRIIYRIIENRLIIEVIAITHRRDAYRRT